MARIVSMEEAANRGDMADLQWFWHHMLQTDVTVASAVAKRLSHIDSLDWEIRTIETANPVLAQEQDAVLRYAYDRIENLKEAAAKLAFAVFTGHSVLEKIKTGYSILIPTVRCNNVSHPLTNALRLGWCPLDDPPHQVNHKP